MTVSASATSAMRERRPSAGISFRAATGSPCLDGRYPVERGVHGAELAAYALDVRSDGAVVHHDVRLAHQLVAVLDVPRKPGERMDHPELRQREFDAAAAPRDREAIQ